MRTEKVSLWNVVIFAGSTISLLVGAGFATGQEVLQYFTGYGLNGFLTAALTLVVIAYAAGSFAFTGYATEFENTNDIFRCYCGRHIGGVYDYFSVVCIYASFIVLIGGAGATVAQYYGLPVYVGCALMAVLSGGTVMLGLGRIVDVIGMIGPVLILFAVGIGLYSALGNLSGIMAGAKLVEAGEVDIYRAGTNWFTAGVFYSGNQMLWLAAFTAAMGHRANSAKEAVLGASLGAVGFALGIIVLMCGMFASIKEVAASDIPSLILAAKIHPEIALAFSFIIMGGIFSSAVPLLWAVSARFAAERSRKFYLLTAALSAAGCLAGAFISFKSLVNIIYSANGAVGIVLLLFMIAGSPLRTRRRP